MFVGHLAVAMLGKRAAADISLGTALLGAMLADLLLYVFLIAGIERFETVPGATLNRVIGVRIEYSHSLAMGLVWAGLLAGVYLWRRGYRRGSTVLFAVVMSHWVLDVMSHQPDMPLAPGIPLMLGLGLWNSMSVSMIVEGGLWAAAILLFVGRVQFQSWAGRIGFWLGVILLTLTWHQNIAAGMDPHPVRAGVSGLIFFSLVIAWGYWMDRATVSLPRREPVSPPGSRATD